MNEKDLGASGRQRVKFPNLLTSQSCRIGARVHDAKVTVVG